MKLTLLFLAFCAIGGLIGYLDEKFGYYYDIFDILGGGLLIIGFIGLACCIVFIITAHIGEDAQIEQDQIEYQALLDKARFVHSEHEDMSEVMVINDVAQWNKKVVSAHRWANNEWTSWFYSKKVVNQLKPIKLELKALPNF